MFLQGEEEGAVEQRAQDNAAYGPGLWSSSTHEQSRGKSRVFHNNVGITHVRAWIRKARLS
jgi:hypothetical protein